MKFSVWDYSQVKIAQFNKQNPHLAIDPTDIFIFTWFKGFANKTRAKTSKKDGSQAKGMWCKTIDGVDYFNVRYDAIINDFPILGVCNVKSIQRRFDKYVEAGIFEKTIVHAGKKGNFTYFAFTDLFLSFEYDNENPEHKEQTKTSDVVQNVQTKPVGVDKNVQTKPVGVDKNVQTLIYNPTISLNNPTTSSTKSLENLDTPVKKSENSFKKEVEEVFLKTINKLFGYNPNFSPDPFPVFIQNCIDCKLNTDFLEEYLCWIFEYLKPKCKNQNNFISYFYKSFTQGVYIAQFVHNKETERQKTLELKARLINCPVCGTVHDKNDYCCPNENCRFPRDELDNEQEKFKQKSLYDLRNNDKEKYDEYQKSVSDLYEKYPMTIIFKDKNMQSELNEKLRELDNKYLNVQITA